MKIAATVKENGHVSSFALSSLLVLYDMSSGTSKTTLSLENIVGNEARVAFLSGQKIDCLLCAGLGNDARSALDAAGIIYVPGVTRDADEAFSVFMSGGNPAESDCGECCDSCKSGSCGNNNPFR